MADKKKRRTGPPPTTTDYLRGIHKILKIQAAILGEIRDLLDADDDDDDGGDGDEADQGDKKPGMRALPRTAG